MTIPEMLGILRTPCGATKAQEEEARLMAADMIEEYLREQRLRRMTQHEGWRHE